MTFRYQYMGEAKVDLVARTFTITGVEHGQVIEAPGPVNNVLFRALSPEAKAAQDGYRKEWDEWRAPSCECHPEEAEK